MNFLPHRITNLVTPTHLPAATSLILNVIPFGDFLTISKVDLHNQIFLKCIYM